MRRVCSKCKVEKDIAEFNKASNAKNTYHYWCRDCVNAWKAEYRKLHRKQLTEKQQKYYKEHKEERASYIKQWYSENQECQKLKKHEYYQKNKEKAIQRIHQWQQENPDRVKIAKSKSWHKRRLLKKATQCDLTYQDWIGIKKKQDFSCAYCGKKRA